MGPWRSRVEGLPAFAAALALILVLELGDKTQLATISLATRHPWTPILAGASLGLLSVTAIGAAAGGILGAFLDPWLAAIQVGGGALFIGIGLWTYLRGGREPDRARDGRGAFASAFSLAFLAELGDKTQIAVIVLAASYRAPVSVFAGAGLGLVFIAAASVLIGRGLARVLRTEWIRRVSAALFIVAGVILILDAIVL